MSDDTTAAETPWHQGVSMPALLRHSRTAYGRAMRQALGEAGCDDVPGNGMYVIGALAIGDNPFSEVVEQLGVSKQAAGQLVDALVLRGYLERAADEADRRRVNVSLTKRGRHAAAIQAAARERVDAELVGRVGQGSVMQAKAVLGALIEIGREGRC